jgi:hypothetical protein
MVTIRKEAYIRVFSMGNGKMTTVIVCDKDEFDSNIEMLSGIYCFDENQNATKESIQKIKDFGCLPLCSLGTKTKPLFDKYEVKTDLLSMMVRGMGPEVVKALGIKFNF